MKLMKLSFVARILMGRVRIPCLWYQTKMSLVVRMTIILFLTMICLLIETSGVSVFMENNTIKLLMGVMKLTRVLMNKL